MHFLIDECYLTSISLITEYSIYAGRASLTDEELVRVLQGKDICSTHANADHPEFYKLRCLLEKEGYIRVERRWWNGDSVLKEFTLNGARFNVNEQFQCGAAIKYQLESKLEWEEREF